MPVKRIFLYCLLRPRAFKSSSESSDEIFQRILLRQKLTDADEYEKIEKRGSELRMQQQKKELESIRFVILGMPYTIKPTEDLTAQDINDLVKSIKELVDSYSQRGYDERRIPLLVAFHIADQKRRLQESQDDEKEQLQELHDYEKQQLQESHNHEKQRLQESHDDEKQRLQESYQLPLQRLVEKLQSAIEEDA